MYTKICTLKKFNVNLMIIMCEIKIHIPLQTQHATITKAKAFCEEFLHTFQFRDMQFIKFIWGGTIM
jgi:hypothetical protein